MRVLSLVLPVVMLVPDPCQIGSASTVVHGY
jgi:hypothetical protein